MPAADQGSAARSPWPNLDEDDLFQSCTSHSGHLSRSVTYTRLAKSFGSPSVMNEEQLDTLDALSELDAELKKVRRLPISSRCRG